MAITAEKNETDQIGWCAGRQRKINKVKQQTACGTIKARVDMICQQNFGKQIQKHPVLVVPLVSEIWTRKNWKCDNNKIHPKKHITNYMNWRGVMLHSINKILVFYHE